MTEATGSALPAAIQQIVELVAESEHGLTAAEVTSAAQARFPGQHPRRIAGLIDQAVRAGALVQASGRMQVPATSERLKSSGEVSAPVAARPVRAVIVDLESVVHTTAAEPYTEKRIFQIGAVRMGTDTDWSAEEPSFQQVRAVAR